MNFKPANKKMYLLLPVAEVQSTPAATGSCLGGWEQFGSYCYNFDFFGVCSHLFSKINKQKIIIVIMMLHMHV